MKGLRSQWLSLETNPQQDHNRCDRQQGVVSGSNKAIMALSLGNASLTGLCNLCPVSLSQPHTEARILAELKKKRLQGFGVGQNKENLCWFLHFIQAWWKFNVDRFWIMHILYFWNLTQIRLPDIDYIHSQIHKDFNWDVWDRLGFWRFNPHLCADAKPMNWCLHYESHHLSPRRSETSIIPMPVHWRQQ